MKYIVSAATGKMGYAWELDYSTFKEKRAVPLGPEHEDYPVNGKTAAYKLAYKLAKQTSNNPVFIWKGDGKREKAVCIAQINYTDNPNAWFANKVITRKDGSWYQLKSDGTIGRFLKKEW